ncbi:MAG: FHA domain-containing protein [Planctomycetota bacterium]
MIGQRALDGVERRAHLGADPRNEIVLEGDPQAARRHAELEKRGGVWRVRDLRSGGETLVNDRKVTSAALKDGDVISVGGHHLKVILDAAEQAAPGDGGADPLIDPANLAHLAPEGAGETFVLDRDLFLVGKDEEADLKLTGWNAPGQLALIVRGQAGAYTLVNLAGAKSGVFHNARDVELRQALKDGDRLELRGTYLTFKKGLPQGGRA